MFNTMKDNWRQSEAATIVQNLLEGQQQGGYYYDDPATMATSLVSTVWQRRLDFFSSRLNTRPHKMTVAALSLAYGVSAYANDRTAQLAFITSLGSVLMELERNSHKYALTRTDHER